MRSKTLNIYLCQVGARALEVGVWGAYYNVMVNIPNVTDEGIKAKVWTYLWGIQFEREGVCLVTVLKNNGIKGSGHCWLLLE